MKLFVIVCAVWFLILLFGNVFFLIKAIKKKESSLYGAAFALSGVSILSAGILFLWGWWCERLDWDVLILSFFAIIAAILYLFVLIAGLIVKCKAKPEGKAFSGNSRIKPVVLAVVIITAVMCAAEAITDTVKVSVEESRYNKTKEEKIEELSAFLNEKYGFELTAQNCVYYTAQDHSTQDYFMGSHTYNIPFVAVFEQNGEYITASDRDGNFSDDYQIEEIGYFLGGHLGFEFAVIRDIHNGNIEDNLLTKVMQNSFGQKVTEDNADELFSEILKTEDLEIILYEKASDDLQMQTAKAFDKLTEIYALENVERVALYLYDSAETLNVQTRGRYAPDDKISDGYYDDYNFSFCYVPNDTEYFYPEGSIFDGEIFNNFVDYIEIN